MKLLAASAFLCGALLFSQGSETPAGFYFWSHADIAKMADALAPQMDPVTKFKSQTIATAGNHRFLVTHREAAGQSEFHETESDIVFAQSGTAKVIYGGKMIGANTTAPGEQRGSGIQGGLEKTIGPGDVMVIPSRTPHEFVPQGSAPFNYFVVKVTDQ